MEASELQVEFLAEIKKLTALTVEKIALEKEVNRCLKRIGAYEVLCRAEKDK